MCRYRYYLLLQFRYLTGTTAFLSRTTSPSSPAYSINILDLIFTDGKNHGSYFFPISRHTFSNNFSSTKKLCRKSIHILNNPSKSSFGSWNLTSPSIPTSFACSNTNTTSSSFRNPRRRDALLYDSQGRLTSTSTCSIARRRTSSRMW